MDWARTLRELRTWLPRLGDSAQPAQAQLSALELVERGALALLFLARQARLQHGEGSAAEALRELRLLASLLQAQARKSAEFGSGADGSDQIDSESAECDWRWVVAATLRPWMCQEAWCSPRVEVVDYRPCCGTGGLLLASNCDHKDLRAVLDIIVCEAKSKRENLSSWDTAGRLSNCLRGPRRLIASLSWSRSWAGSVCFIEGLGRASARRRAVGTPPSAPQADNTRPFRRTRESQPCQAARSTAGRRSLRPAWRRWRRRRVRRAGAARSQRRSPCCATAWEMGSFAPSSHSTSQRCHDQALHRSLKACKALALEPFN